MTLEKVGFMKCRGYPEPGNGVPGLAQDLIYNLQPLQVGSVSQNRCNLELPQAFSRSLPPQIHQTFLHVHLVNQQVKADVMVMVQYLYDQ